MMAVTTVAAALVALVCWVLGGALFLYILLHRLSWMRTSSVSNDLLVLSLALLGISVTLILVFLV